MEINIFALIGHLVKTVRDTVRKQCTEGQICRGCCSSATQWATYDGDSGCGEEDILTDAKMRRLVQDQCMIRMWHWDNNKQGLERTPE